MPPGLTQERYLQLALENRETLTIQLGKFLRDDPGCAGGECREDDQMSYCDRCVQRGLLLHAVEHLEDRRDARKRAAVAAIIE